MLINNAAISNTQWRPGLTIEEYSKKTRPSVAHARIVNVSSGLGSLNAMTVAMAIELREPKQWSACCAPRAGWSHGYIHSRNDSVVMHEQAEQELSAFIILRLVNGEHSLSPQRRGSPTE